MLVDVQNEVEEKTKKISHIIGLRTAKIANSAKQGNLFYQTGFFWVKERIANDM